MSIAFVDRNPSHNETLLLQIAFSTFCDGTGMEMEKNGEGTRPGWRDFERVIGEVMAGKTPEGKQVFDVYVGDNETPNVDVGLSIKSKELSRVAAIGDLDDSGRVYMETANSPAKFADALGKCGILLDSDSFGKNNVPAENYGKCVLDLVHQWHDEGRIAYSTTGRELDIDRSIYLVVSYSKPRNGLPREYQLHSFALELPTPDRWEFRAPHKGKVKCIVGYDANHPTEKLYEWYPFSGGQLKYHPRTSESLYRSERFTLLSPPCESIIVKAMRYWPGVVSESEAGYVVKQITKGSTDTA